MIEGSDNAVDATATDDVALPGSTIDSEAHIERSPLFDPRKPAENATD